MLLIATAVLAVAGMAHHPTGSGGDDASVVASIAAVGAIARGVHGLLVSLMLLQAWLLLEILRPGTSAALDRLGMLAWLLGTLLMTGAALLSGFAAPALAADALGGDAETMARTRDLLAFGHVLNQVLSKAGLACWMAAVAAWSLGLPARARGDRWLLALAVFGGLLAAVTLVGLGSGHLRLDVHGMGLAMLGLSAWLAGLGAAAIAGRTTPS